MSWQTHAAELNRMKDDINATAKTVVALTNAKAQAVPWQATAIDRIIPFMKEIAADTTAAIDYLNKNQSKLNMKEYKDYTQENAQTSQELSTLIAHFVDYGNHKDRYESLRKSLELPATK
jgi:beta-xylosidase